MNKINKLMSLVAVSVCCMYGCDSGETIVYGQANDVGALTDGGKSEGDNTIGDKAEGGCEKGQKYVDGVCYTISNYCDTDADCKGGYICKSNVCTKKTSGSADASCADHKKNGNETDIDCGGSCYRCAENKRCNINADCMSNRCEGGICKAVEQCSGGSCNVEVDPCKDGGCQGEVDSCKDGKRSGNESDVDCGGSCALCADGKACNSGSDCESGICDGVCVSCSDGVRNGDESDVDCGGACGKCADGAKCNSKADCANGFCDANVCTSCSDGVRNGDETDADCGGRCGASCAADKRCNSDNDCETYHCVDQMCRSIDCPDKAEVGEIIINEVFSNPDTNAKMQHSNNKQMKYIELYNKSDRTLQLYNLSLTYGGNEVHAKGCIPAKSYLVIHPAGQKLTALDIDAKTLASDNIDAAIGATSGAVRLVKRADGAVIHSATVPETEKGTAAGRAAAEGSSTNDEAMVPHSSVKTIEAGVKNLYTPGLPNNVGFPMG